MTEIPRLAKLSDFVVSYTAIDHTPFDCEVLHTPTGKTRLAVGPTYSHNTDAIEEIVMELVKEGWAVAHALEVWLGWVDEE